MDWLSPLREITGLILSFLEHIPIIRAILGVILVFFLPGFAWTFVFFKQISVIERMALSFGLSIAVVILSIFLLNVLLGTRITGFNSVLIIITVTILPLVVYYLRRFIKGRLSRES